MGDVHEIFLANVDNEFGVINSLGTASSTYAMQKFGEACDINTISESLQEGDC